MENIALELVETAIKTADKPALEDRCLKALSKLSTLRLSNEFLASTEVGNLFSSFKSNPHWNPVIRESADHLLNQWLRQLYNSTPTEKPHRSPVLALDSNSQRSTKTLQNPNPRTASQNKADPVETLALELVDIAIKTAATISQPLDDRCIKALRKLSTLNLGSDFIMSSDIANMVDYSLNSNGRLKPLIRGYAYRLLARWTVQIPIDKKPGRCTLKRQNKEDSSPPTCRKRRNTQVTSPNFSDQVRRDIRHAVV